MSKRRRAPSLEEETAALGECDPNTPDGRAGISAGLASARSFVVKRAAELVKERQVEGLEAELSAAFSRLLVDPAKADPGCHAKLALLEALDWLDASEEETFLLGAQHVQLEAAWGPPVDTATGVRARSVLALARTGYPDLALLAGELLGDPEPPVRQAAADALAARGARAGAGILLLKLRAGDADPMVTLAVMSALLALAPDWALPRLERRLHVRDGEARELAALALGQSRRDDALALLLTALEDAVRTDDRATVLRAIGLHRSDRALEAMLGVIEGGRPVDARAAIVALAVRRFEPDVCQRARSAAQRNPHAELGPDADAAFGDE